MKVGQFTIEEVNNQFHIKYRQESLDIFSTLREAMNVANIYVRVYEFGYKNGKGAGRNEVIEAREYHYM